MRLTCSLEHTRCAFLLRYEDDKTVLFQADWDYPSLASNFGWVACECGETDGTIDCPHKTASRMIAEAEEFLDAHVGDVILDPGYHVAVER